MTTLKDIAELTGVSVNTVSRALKDKPDIGAKTKERVRRAAATLSYVPNALARGLATRRSNTLGLVATELSNPARSALIEALRRLALDNGHQLLVGGFETEAQAEGQLREMLARGVDGLVLGNIEGILSEKPYWPSLESALRSGVVVVAFYQAQTSMIDQVAVDFPMFTGRLTSHLIETHGLRDIRFAGPSPTYARYQGYSGAMRNAGLGDKAALLPLSGWSMADARRGVVEFLKDNPPPQGIVCNNDLAAIGIMAGLRDKGLRVPEDVAVVGIDNIELADYLNPALTSAGAPPAKVAEALFGLLRSRIDGSYSGTGRQVELPFELFLRGSCGCGRELERP